MSQSIILAMLALAAIGSADPQVTSPPIYSSSVTSPPMYSSSSCSLTVCADYINSCSQTYGGCYEMYDGFTTPSFTDPGCPSTTDSPSNTTPPPETTSCFLTLCIDNMNSCSQMYGGCFPACGNYTTPSFADPGCPSTTRTSTTSTTSCTSSIVKSPSTPTTTSCTAGMVTSTTSTTSSTSCTQTVCADYINSCGLMYGGCFPACGNYTTPSFADPGCPSTTQTSTTSCTSSIVKSPSTPTTTSCTAGMVTSTTSTTSSTSCTQTVCADYNSCGLMYGGCFPYCEGYTIPSFSVPDCPTSYSPSTSTGY